MTHVPRVSCVVCCCEMLINHTGASIEMIANWGSYYKMYMDVYQCPHCKSTVALAPERPVPRAINYEEDYTDIKTDYQVAI